MRRRQLRRLCAAIAASTLLAACALPGAAFAVDSRDLPTAWGKQTIYGEQAGFADGESLDPVWPRLPTDAEIADAVARAQQSRSDATGWEDAVRFGMLTKSTELWSDTVSVKPIKIHQLDPNRYKVGDPATGDFVVAEVVTRFRAIDGTTRDMTEVYALLWRPSRKHFMFGGLGNSGAAKPFPDQGRYFGPMNLQGYYELGFAPGWSDGGGVSGGAGPWRTAGAGAAAVAAAAAALAGSIAQGRGRKTKLDPREPVGYVLQIPVRTMRLSATQSAPVDIAAWRVLASGSYEAADDVTITLEPPPGVGVQPASGVQALSAVVWQTGDLAGPVQLGVSAAGAKGGTRQTITLEPEGLTMLEVATEPAGRSTLRPNGRDVISVTARVVLSPAAAADPALDVEQVRRSITFTRPGPSEWLNVGDERDIPGGKAVPVSATPPDPDHPGTPPAQGTFTVTAKVGAQLLQEQVSLTFERPPVLDARPDVVEFAVDTRANAECLVWIEPADSGEWTFSAKWRDGDRAVAEHEIVRRSGSSVAVRLTEAAGALPPTGGAKEACTLAITAEQDGYDPLERYIKVVVTREGVFIDATDRGRDGTFHVAADGSGRTTTVDVRVYVRDEASGEIRFDGSAAQSLSVEPVDEQAERTVRSVHLVHARAGLRPGEPPSAKHEFRTERVLPTSGKPLPVTYRFSVEGRDEPQFTANATLSLDGIDTSPYSAAWDTEYERCRKIIEDYVPLEFQGKLLKVLAERGKLMGAEGIYEMRRRVWAFAQTQLQKEINEQLDRAWYLEQAESLADWVSWCGDIAFGVASGSLVGTGAAVALGMLKPVLVSAVTAYVNDKDIGDWAWEQVGILGAVLEGCATDVDLLAKLTGGNKALAWAAFISYTFVREIQRDPNHSVADAMKNIARQLRDEGLIQFLRHFAMKGAKVPPTGAHPDGGPAATGGRKPVAPEPPAPVPPAPEPPTGHGPEGAAPPAGKPGPDVAGPKGKPVPEADAPKGPKDGAEPAPGKPKDGESPADGAPDTKKKPEAPEKPGKPEKAPVGPPVQVPPPGTPMNGRQAAALVHANTTVKDGKPYVDRDTMSRIMRDPDAARQMRTQDPKAWEAYENTRSEARKVHDAALEHAVTERYPEYKDKKVVVQTVGTEGGIDRDYRVLVEVPDPANPGKPMYIEVPKEKWQADSNRIFSEQTGGPADPKAQAEWAAKHQQVGTDQYHGEAAIDMADQGWRRNPDGTMTQVQTPPRVEMVKAGHDTLIDPEGLGKTYETKVAEAGKHGQLDAFAQAKKAVDTLEGCREGYTKQGYDVGQLSPKVKQGMDIVRMVADGKLTPAEGDRMLSDNKLGDLTSFMGKVSSQIGSLKLAHR